MLVIRPTQQVDFPTLENFAQTLKNSGFTSLPPSKQALQRNLEDSLQSFKHQTGSMYWFALEDTEQKKVVGCCSILLHIGRDEPFYSYNIGELTQSCQTLNIMKHHKVLHLVNHYRDVTEVGTLYLNPNYRGQSVGKLLSLTRFLFIAQFRQLFSDTIIADMRGYLDDSGHSPFWHALGQHFFGMNFTRADYLSAITDKQFIADLVPKHPIYCCLLSPEAQSVIGFPHQTSQRAQTILKKEGFQFNHFIDIFDAGPTMEASFDQIKTIQMRQTKTLKTLRPMDNAPATFIVCNTKLQEFRSTVGALSFEGDSEVHMSPELAEQLRITVGETLNFIPI